MIRTVFGYLNKRASPHKKVKVEPIKVTKAVYRDELITKGNKRQQSSPSKESVKKRVRFADSEPTILGEEFEIKDTDEKRSSISDNNEFAEKDQGAVRVKVKMTKEEAARFLSKCNNGGIFDLKDIARELVLIPVNRVSVVSTCTNNL